jgi:glycosyltransferase involved in cell wall biosynthesis
VRVGVDGRSLRSSASSRGVSRYVHHLLAALGRGFPGDEYTVLVPAGAGVDTGELEAAGVELRSPAVDSRLLFGAAALTGRPRVDRLLGGCDVVFVPAIAPVAVSREVPLVLTVHDLTFEHRPKDFTPYSRAWHRVARPRRLAHRAARVITVSESVRRDLLSEWRLPAEDVVSIPSGPGSAPGDPGSAPGRLGSAPGEPAPPPPGVPARYVLAVGALEPRKRPDLLVQAHARARANGLQAELVLAGDGPMRAELEGSQATVLGYVDDATLEGLYANALALVCVSREEGFSFTPLEAIARDTPAIVSDLPVFAETLGDGALRVPPGDAEALAHALLALERDGELRERLVTSGKAALARLSWDRAAADTREVLREAARP